MFGRKRAIVSGVLLMVFMGVAACASTGAGDRNPNLITAEEIEAYASLDDAYQLVQQLRPRWLVESPSRSLNNQTMIVVYMDSTPLGDTSELRTIPLNQISRIRALSSSEAGFLPGLSGVHISRAIVIETR